jgi:hypothetical protein
LKQILPVKILVLGLILTYLKLKKKQCLEFQSMNCGNTMTIMIRKLSRVTETRFVGLTIDNALSWKQHIDLVANGLSYACYALQNEKYIVICNYTASLFCSHTVHHELWYNPLGCLLSCQKSVHFAKEND